MELKDFGKHSSDWHYNFVASHFPTGKAWARVKDFALLIKSVSFMSSMLWDKMTEIIHGFLPSMATDYFLTLWEDSLGLDHTGTIEERRNNVKVQIRKRVIVNVSEWEKVLSDAVGRSVTVYPAKDIDMTDNFFLFPYVFPIYFYPVNHSETKQNRFILYCDEIRREEQEKVDKIVQKFKPNNVRAVYIDRT